MGIVKNQHYVPRFYLKYFASSGSKIFCYDKKVNKSFETNINNIAAEKLFYDLDKSLAENEGIEDIQHLEKQYSYIESEFAPYYAEFLDRLNSKEFKITECDRDKIASYLSIQIERTKNHRDESAKIVTAFNKALNVWGISVQNVHGCNTGVRSKRDIHTENILFGDKFRECIKEVTKGHIWIIFENNTNIPFLTSDNPIITIPHKEDNIRSYRGLNSEGVQIAFPLSPKYILILAERKAYKEFIAIENQIKKLNATLFIEYYNSHIEYYALRQVYSNRVLIQL